MKPIIVLPALLVCAGLAHGAAAGPRPVREIPVVQAPMVLARMGRRDRQQRARELLEKVDLGDRGHHYPSELSGGQQQRVAIARALANNPPILIGDEMTGDLDSVTGFAIMELVASLNKEGMTVVFVTHDPRMAEFASRVIELRDGRILDE